jgi:hypothetical protein
MSGNIGGARPGAGRKRGIPNKASRELKEIAREYTELAVLGRWPRSPTAKRRRQRRGSTRP